MKLTDSSKAIIIKTPIVVNIKLLVALIIMDLIYYFQYSTINMSILPSDPETWVAKKAFPPLKYLKLRSFRKLVHLCQILADHQESDSV